jgi:hypothetical protein
MHETLDPSTVEYLKSTEDRYSYRSEPEKVTVCYLILPSRTAHWETLLDPALADCGRYQGVSASSMLVDRSSLDLTSEHQRRFARAMLRLALKPSVHPSQLQDNLSAASTIGNSPSLKPSPRPASNKEVSGKDEIDPDTVTTKRIKDLEQSQWPKLMLLASHSCHDP